MGWWSAAVGVARDALSMPRPITLELPPEQTFDTAPRPVADVISEMMGTGSAPRVSRIEALSVAAVQRGRNELCSVATLPLRLYRGLDIVDSPLLRQINPDVANLITISQLIEDLAFEGIAWLQVTGQDFDGYPVSARHVDVASVSLQPPARRDGPEHTPAGYTAPGKPSGPYVYVDGKPVSAALMIRFDSPNPGLLRANGRAIRRALLLDRLAAMFAENPQLREYFTDTDDPSINPMDDDEINAFLAEYQTARRLRPVGWIPSTVKRADVNAPSPVDLQLVQLQQQVTLEIANGLGVDPEDLGISTTSRTYFNAQDRAQQRINRTLAPYMAAITQRLSMGDVTRRGYEARFDTTEWLRADPTSQAAYWRQLKDMGVMDAKEIRAAAGLSGAPPKAEPAPATESRATPQRFDAGTMTFSVSEFAAAAEPPKVDVESRTITGLALPYNAVASKFGVKYRFKPGSLEYDPGQLSHLKHLQNHSTPVGVHTAVDDTPAGPVVKLSVLGGVDGSPEKLARDQLLYDAQNGLYDGLSVGVEFSLFPEDGDVVLNEEDGVYDVVRATWRETSSTPLPAFTGARVTKVAASLTGGDQMDPCQHCGHRHAPGIACATFAAQMRTAPAPAPQPTPQPDPVPPTTGQFATGPTLVNPHHGPAVVNEPAPYRFIGGHLRAGSHDFSTDIIAGSKGDVAALERAQTFVADHFAAFDVDRADLTAINPNRNRPDMWVDQRTYRYPVWDAVNKGTLQDSTPFVIPKFNSASGLVAAHTEGTEPTPGTYTATSQTITPTAVSGKVEITREAWDQGGNPQLSGLVWRQMEKAYYEALEARIVAVLDAASPAALNTFTAGGGTNKATLVAQLTAGLAGLQFVRGGFSMDNAFLQIDLYKDLIAATDTAGRPIYPALGPTNTNGTVGNRFGSIEMAPGVVGYPAWALAASGSVAASSYLFDSDSVHGWATAPQRLQFEYRVAYVDLAIWGYGAAAITDINGVREISYDPVA